VEKYPALQHLSQFCPAGILGVGISLPALETGQVWKTSKDGSILNALEVGVLHRFVEIVSEHWHLLEN
jgi:hypothetical protein